MQQPRRPVHRPWTEKNRIMLCLLKRSYERKHVGPIWSQIFRTQLTVEGFNDGIPATTLDAQYQELKGGGVGYEIYTHINDATQESIERQYGAYLDEIRQAILHLDLRITFRASRLSRPARRINPPRRPAQRRAIPASIASEEDSAISNSESVRPELQQFAFHHSPYFTNRDPVQAAHACERSETPVPPILNISTDRYGVASRQHPLLLFRATPTITSFCSRKFDNWSMVIPHPPVFGSQEFKDIVWPHLERDRSYPSPFISFAQNPRNAVRRIELTRSEEVEKKMFLAIFAFNDLEADAKEQYGEATGPYLVRSLFSAKEISDLPDGYKGTGEWLTYGKISCDPIVILDSAQAIKLVKALRHFKIGEADALLDIHKALQSVRNKWKEAIAFNFLRHYCGRSQLPVVGSHAYKLLMQVIRDGQTRSLARLAAHCERASTEEVEHRWIATRTQGGVLEEDEDEDEEYEVNNEERPPGTVPVASRALFRPVQVNVPHRSQLSSRLIVSRLNTLSQRDDNVVSKTRGADSTPLWSSDSSESENNTQMQYNKGTRSHSLAGREVTSVVDDWDLIGKDLETSFTEEFPSAARKLPLRKPQTQTVAQSIEHNNQLDRFTAELLRSAYESSPLPTLSRTSGQAARMQTARTAPQSPTLSNTNFSNSSFVDLAKDTTSDYVVVTPRKLITNSKKRASPPPNTDDEEDLLVTGSGRRQRVRLTMRILSVQDKDDDEFMSASEIF